jgi:23S rRNA pseudouridine2605 synthase
MRARRIPESSAPRHAIVRVLSKLGVCSRMQAVELVLAGRVRIGARVVRDPGERCRFDEAIAVDGLPVSGVRRRYILINKPRGFVTSRSDERDRKTVYDLLEGIGVWVSPVGRLDRDSEGILLLTNDTRFAAWLTDPANAVPRVYEVTVKPTMTEAEVEALTTGVDIGHGELSRPTAARIHGSVGDTTTISLTLVEGKNRELRRLFQARSRRVLRLRRTSFGPFLLDDMEPGAWREAPITAEEARRIQGRGPRGLAG